MLYNLKVEQEKSFIGYNTFTKYLRTVNVSLSDECIAQKPTALCSALECIRKNSEFIIEANKSKSYSPWWNY